MAEIKIKDQKLSTSVEEVYKSLRTNLFFCGREKQVIAVTSCHAREGKSSVSLNLAMSLAEAQMKTIYIDADLRNSTFLGKVSVSGERLGLAYFLSGLTESQDIICTTDHENLDVIMTGRFPPNPAELLGRPEFRELLEQLRLEYDYIIVDTPPVGSVIDSAIIAESCDGLIFVVEANSTSYRFAQQVKEQLEKTSCPILGAILNKVDVSKQGYGKYGRYGSYGQYGQYGLYGQRSTKPGSKKKKKGYAKYAKEFKNTNVREK